MNVSHHLQNAVRTGMICLCLVLGADTSHLAAGHCHTAKCCDTCRAAQPCQPECETCRGCGTKSDTCEAEVSCGHKDCDTNGGCHHESDQGCDLCKAKSECSECPKKSECPKDKHCDRCRQECSEKHSDCGCGGEHSECSTGCDGKDHAGCHKSECHAGDNRSKPGCPKGRVQDTRARIEGRAGGGDAVIWVKFPSLTELEDRRPKTSINFTEYAWAGNFRSFRTRIPDSKPRRYYISASDGLVPIVAGREYDANIDSYYVNLAPGTTAEVIFSEPKTKVSDSRGLVYRWSKSNGGNFEPRGKATIDNNGLIQLADGAYRPLGVNAKLLKACKSSGALSIELTLKTNKQVQKGPARIVSFSVGAHSSLASAQREASD
jgi:hypothetical protein